MTFWSGEKLRTRLGAADGTARPIIETGYNEDRLDCASYRLCVGPEIYVTPSAGEESSRTKQKLNSVGDPAIIPPGQFAFLLTEEIIHIPDDAIGWISMRSGLKFKGLVNVSGFHVDPGYHGRLIFSVFNAGPSPIHVARGEELFVLFLADLGIEDGGTLSGEVKKGLHYTDIPTKIINPIANEVMSLVTLNTKIGDVEKRISDKMQAMERDNAVSRWASAILIGAIITLGVRQCAEPPKETKAETTGAGAAQSPTPPSAVAPSTAAKLAPSKTTTGAEANDAN